MSKIEVLYADAKWKIPDNWDSEENILEKIRSVNMQSNPGIPLVLNGKTNGEMIEAIGENVLVYKIKERIEQLKKGELVSDLVRLFVKQEPHSKEKADLERWRLIWLVSFTDQVIDALLFDPSIDSEIEHHRTIPSKPGWTWLKGGLNDFKNQMDDFSDKLGTSDKSSWDWTVQYWEYLCDLERRQRLCINPDHPSAQEFFYLQKLRYQILSCGKIQFSDGEAFQQTINGIVRSGSKITISINSFCQVFNKVLYCEAFCEGGFQEKKHKIAAIGDDAFERFHGIDIDHYKKFLEETCGHIVKYIQLGKFMDLHFCSHNFTMYNGICVGVPDNLDRHLYRLKIKEKSKIGYLTEQLASYCIEHAHNPVAFKIFYDKLVQLDQSKARSPQYYKDLHTGFECAGGGSDFPAIRAAHRLYKCYEGGEISPYFLNFV